jgi:hypothetical protein
MSSGSLTSRNLLFEQAASYKDSPDIAAALAASKTSRSAVYLTTKILAGNGDSASDCAADPNTALDGVRTALKNL